MKNCSRQGRRLLQPAQVVTGSSAADLMGRPHEEVCPGIQCVVYKRLYIDVGSHHLYASVTLGVVPPSPLLCRVQ